MNLFDVLFMAKTGTVKPGASMFDILFAQKLRGAAEKIVTILGNPLSFVTKKAQTAISTKISMEPIQEGSGDPSPTNVRPISGRTGVEIDGCGINIWDEEWVNEKADINQTTGQIVPASSFYFRSKNPIPILPNVTYHDVNGTIHTYRLFFYKQDGTYIGFVSHSANSAFTTPDEANYMLFRWTSTEGATYANNISINYPATDTEYHAYTPNTAMPITVQFPALGHNQWDEEWESGRYGSGGEKVADSSMWRCKNPIPVTPNENYAFIGKNIESLGFRRYDQNGQYVGNGIQNLANKTYGCSFTANSDAHFITFFVNNESTKQGDISISYPATFTTYEPYTNTVYGGTLDVEKGELTVDRAMVDLGTLNWQERFSLGGDYTFSASITTPYKYYQNVNAICSKYEYGGTVTAVADMRYKSQSTFCLFCSLILQSYTIYIKHNEELTPAQFKQSLQGVQLCYELAEPTTIQLTPEEVQLLKGANTLWTDGDEIELTYKA